MLKALFLDRDGTINVDYGYVYEPEKFDFIPGVVDFCRWAQDAGYTIIVITNQSGVARGYYTEEQMNACNAFMVGRFAEAGVSIADVFTCTSLDESHPDRKPNPGLFLKARDKHDIDMAVSVSIGDKPRDVEAGERAGVGVNLLLEAATEDAFSALAKQIVYLS